METIENSESESKVSFIACIIPAFADAYKMSVPNAYSYLKKYGGLNYLLDEWWALHTENILNAFVKDKKIDVDSASELFYSSKYPQNRSSFMKKILSKFALAAGIALAVAFILSCSSGGDSGEGGGSTCNADFGKITIGTQTWAKRNLNCEVAGSECYNNDPANCAKYCARTLTAFPPCRAAASTQLTVSAVLATTATGGAPVSTMLPTHTTGSWTTTTTMLTGSATIRIYCFLFAASRTNLLVLFYV